MDSRYHHLRDTLAYQGLSEDECAHGLDLLDVGPADRCESYATLLRGALADRGQLLGGPAMAQRRGLVSGTKLMTRLLSDQKGKALDNAEVNRGLLAITRKGLTCAELLAMYLKLRQAIADRKTAA